MKNFQKKLGGVAILGLGLAASLATVPTNATAASVEMGVQVRYRGEADARDFNDQTGADVVHSERARLTAKIKEGRYHAFLQIQDARVWGAEVDSNGDPAIDTLTSSSANGLDMHQAFLKVDDVFGTGIGIQAGRQEINFADQRLVGAEDWDQNARSLDGIIFSRAFGDAGVIVPFYLQLVENDTLVTAADGNNEGKDHDIWVAGFHSAWNIAEGQSLQPHLYVVRAGLISETIYTLGVYYQGTAGPLSWDVTGDYQTGKAGNADINAYMAAGNISFQTGPVMVSAGCDYLSGDDGHDADKIKSFTTLLGSNHEFYGAMDYFDFNVLSAVNDGARFVRGLGLIDPHVKASYQIEQNTTADAAVHYFMTAEKEKAILADANGKGVDQLGTELDLSVKHQTGPVTVRVGYSAFFQDDAMEALAAQGTNNEDVTHWGYVMASIALP